MRKSYRRNYTRKNIRRINSKSKSKSKRFRGSCDMSLDLNYKTPCQGLPLKSNFALNGGYNANPSSGCTSYQIDVTQPFVGGQSVVSGNPDGCLENQMNNTSNFGLSGGGASCTGVGFGLNESQQIAGQPGVFNYSPNCMYGEVSGGAKAKGAKAKGAKAKGAKAKGAKAKGSNMSKKDGKILRDAVNKYCERKQMKCTLKFKKDLYNIVRERLCK
jgi:hypothetical protein